MRLTLWCEYPDQEHPACVIGSGGSGEGVIKQPKGRLVKIAPYAKMVATLLGAAVPIAADVAKVAVDPKLLEDLEGKIDLMQTLTDKLLEVGKELGELSSHDLVHSELDEPYSLMYTTEGAGLRQLYSLLLELDSSCQWGGLRRALIPTGDYLWVCPTHYPIFDPGLPSLS